MLALCAAFWLQLENPSSAAVTVAILAQPTRDQALSRALHRCLGTAVGFITSLVLVALFRAGACPHARQRLNMASAVRVRRELSGGCPSIWRAVLSGYNVEIIAVDNMDSPQNVFDTGVARDAVIVSACSPST
jgi:uncharacterized membrane protein YccC